MLPQLVDEPSGLFNEEISALAASELQGLFHSREKCTIMRESDEVFLSR